MTSMFAIVSVPLGWLMRLMYNTIGNYGLTLLAFTLFTKVLLFPLAIKQQKSMAKQSAYQPMIQEIQKKWANDKNRQNEELIKLQQEYGFSPTAGCLPMLVQLPIMFGLIDVIYRPMRYILAIPVGIIEQLEKICKGMATLSRYSPQSSMVQIIAENPSRFTSILTADQLAAIQGFDLNFLGLNLADVPTLAFNALLIIPVLSVVTMVAMQLVTLRLNGNTQGRAAMGTTAFSAIMFGVLSFSIPCGVSLYWIFSNIFGLLQAFILKMIYDPAKYKAELEAEIAAKKAAKKQKKKVALPKDDGTVEEKEVTQSELDRLRLQRARELDRQKYGDE